MHLPTPHSISLTFVGLDYQFDPHLLQEAILKKRYALVGFAAFLCLTSPGNHFNEGMDETIRQEMETTPSTYLPGRHPGDYSFRLVSEV